MGKLLIYLGLVLIIIGVLAIFFPKIFLVGKLPGDIYFRKGNFIFYFPIVTSLILSIILTVIINLIIKRK